ncbi:MAG TPA: sigma-54 dependent transcriptional regulator [Terracidiphilus sp.]
MQPFSVPVLPSHAPRIRPRTAVLASSDRSFRQRLNETLTGLRWQVREAESGAKAWAEAQTSVPEAVIVDSWLPDLDLAEFVKDFRSFFPAVDLVTSEGSAHEGARSPYRQELLYALRICQDNDTAVWNVRGSTTAEDSRTVQKTAGGSSLRAEAGGRSLVPPPSQVETDSALTGTPGMAAFVVAAKAATTQSAETAFNERLPELIGKAPSMLDVSRRIRLVAPRSTQVLIEGPTGSGKELVAEALHRLSTRNRKPFVAINCAAIPEALLEAELFGHTRGAFTGAVQGRVGRIESADGGTLFLDEIGEMPLSLQSKLLRFVESGELQRVGDNETVKVDVRIVAATHRPLAKHTQEGTFRADLYYRLAVFLIRTPALVDHAQDIPLLVDHFLKQMGRDEPMKRVNGEAMASLAAHSWPGNVRELEHVLERAAILAGDSNTITAREIDFGMILN